MDLSPTNSTRVQSQQRAPNTHLHEPSLTDQQHRTHQVAEEALGTAPSEAEVLPQSQGDITEVRRGDYQWSLDELLTRFTPERIERLHIEQLQDVAHQLKYNSGSIFRMIEGYPSEILDDVLMRWMAIGSHPDLKDNRQIQDITIAISSKMFNQKSDSIRQETKEKMERLIAQAEKDLEEARIKSQETKKFLQDAQNFKTQIQQHGMPSVSSSHEHETPDPIEEPILYAQPNLPIDEPQNNGNNHCLIVAIIISGMYLLYMGVSYVSNCLNNRSIFRGSSNDGGEL